MCWKSSLQIVSYNMAFKNFNRPSPSSQHLCFQNEATGKCKTFLAKTRFIFKRIKNNSCINGFALSLTLKQRLEETRKWFIHMYPMVSFTKNTFTIRTQTVTTYFKCHCLQKPYYLHCKDATVTRMWVLTTLRVEPRSFCLLDWGGEKKALPELHQTFEAAAAQTSGLVNLVLSRQTVFFLKASIHLLISRWS